jgi:plasmid stabilization system protein ParE
MRLLLPSVVEKEIAKAARWYEARRPGLFDAFLEAVEDVLKRLGENPALYPVVVLDIHRAPLQRFPYSIYYFTLNDTIQILAVVHDARHPAVWRRRRLI